MQMYTATSRTNRPSVPPAKSTRRAPALLCALLALFPLCVAAQQTPLPGERDLIRERQQRLLDEQRQRLDELRHLPGPAPTPTPEAAPAPRREDHCVTIQRIRLQGAALIPEARQRQIVSPFEGRCLDSAQLNDLLRHITQYYLDRGHITSRAYLPEQDMTGGELNVLIIEGKLEGLERGEHGPSAREIFMTFPGRTGERLDLRALEQMVDQLNRLPSRRAQIDLLPGADVGGSRVQVQGTPLKPWRASLRRDNTGEKSTGEQQWGASLAWDSPLGLADQLTLSGGRDAEAGPWRRANNQSVFYSLPYGWWTFSYHYSQNYYQARHDAAGFRFQTHGESRRHQLSAERLLHRDASGKTGASLGLARLSTRNYFEDVRLALSSHRLSELQFGLHHGRRLGSTFLNLDLGWQRGIGALGAQGRGHPKAAEPDARYTKYTLTASLLQPFVLGGQHFSLESLAHAQHSEDALFSPQRITVGGLASVRGFKERTVTGNSGGYWRTQLRWRRPLGWAWLRAVVSEFSVALAYDLGAIARNQRQGDSYRRLSGHALELTTQGTYFSASLTLARALERPDGIQREHPLYFAVNLGY